MLRCGLSAQANSSFVLKRVQTEPNRALAIPKMQVGMTVSRSQCSVCQMDGVEVMADTLEVNHASFHARVALQKLLHLLGGLDSPDFYICYWQGQVAKSRYPVGMFFLAET